MSRLFVLHPLAVAVASGLLAVLSVPPSLLGQVSSRPLYDALGLRADLLLAGLAGGFVNLLWADVLRLTLRQFGASVVAGALLGNYLTVWAALPLGVGAEGHLLPVAFLLALMGQPLVRRLLTRVLGPVAPRPDNRRSDNQDEPP